MNKKKKKILIGVVAAVVVVICVAFAIIAAPLTTLKEGQIHAGVFLGPVDVSNLTEAEAEAKVLDYINEYEKGKIAFKVGQEEKDFNADELKIQWTDKEAVKAAYKVGREGSIFSRYNVLKALEKEKVVIPVKLSYDEEATNKMIGQMAKEFNNEAQDASIRRENGKFVIEEGKEGIVLDEEAAKTVIEEYFGSKWNVDERQVELPATIQQPKGSVEELQKIQDCIGSYKTYCGFGESRVQNIVNGTKRINGHVIYPGETFSANAAMEPYDAQNGYVLGGAYENGTVVQSYGGGICQVSSTLYNAALLAEIEIAERSPHSMMVGYVQPSMDAAIAGTWKDLKIKNNFDVPIYIEGYVKDGYVNFNLYGKETRSSSRKIEFISETISSTPAGTTIEQSADFPVGYFEQKQGPHTGLKARLWKVVYENGKEVSRTEVNNSEYRASNAIYVIGTGGASAEQAAAIRAAAEAGDKDAAEAAASAGGAPSTPEPSAPQTPQTPQTPDPGQNTPPGGGTPNP